MISAPTAPTLRQTPVRLGQVQLHPAQALLAVLDSQGLIREASHALLTRLGLSADEVNDRSITTLLSPEHRAEMAVLLARAAEGTSSVFSLQMLTRSGEAVPVGGDLIRFQCGEGAGLLLVCSDLSRAEFTTGITALQRDLGVALSATSDLHEALRLVLDASMHATNMDSGGVYLLDKGTGSLRLRYQIGLPEKFIALVGAFEASSPQVRRWREGQAIYTQFRDLARAAQTPEPEAAIEAGLKSLASIPLFGGQELFGCLNFASRNDDEISMHARTALESIASQFASAIVRIEAQEAFVRLSTRFQALVDRSSDMIALIDANRTLRYTTPAFERLTGFESGAFVSVPLESLLHPEDVAQHNALMAELLSNPGGSFHNEARVRSREGSWRTIEYHATNLLSDSQLEGIVINGWDVTDQRYWAEAVRVERDLVRSLLDASPIATAFISPEGLITDCNQASVQQFGCASKQELIGRTVHQIVAPRDHALALDLFKRVLEGETVRNVELKACTLDGVEFDAEMSGSVLRDKDNQPIGLVAMVQNVSERKRLEEDLRQAQKMESIGRLAGGIAHDFNNILTAIKGFASLARAAAGNNDAVVSDIEAVLTAASRAEKLTGQLLAFSRRQILRPKRVAVNRLLLELAEMLDRALGDHIVLDLQLDTEDATVEADRQQLENLIVNLSVNARDAMPCGGKLTIETASHALAPAPDDREYVRLSIHDTGTGIPDSMLPYVFEPFFTSKSAGSGTGLGLATVYGIVKQHRGHIRVSSFAGAGTRFDVYLPRLDAPPDEEADEGVAEAMPRGDETVLVVEDEAMVRATIVRVLGQLGYDVLEADRGTTALTVLQQHPNKVHLLLTDVVMPEMGGKELVDRVRAQYPLMKVLYMSGYTRDSIVHDGVLDQGINFLSKPFAPHALATKVRAVLDS